MSRLLPHAVSLALIALCAVGFDLIGLALPPLDAILAPGGVGLVDLAATLLALGARLVAVLVLPGLVAAILIDAALLLLVRRERGAADAG